MALSALFGFQIYLICRLLEPQLDVLYYLDLKFLKTLIIHIYHNHLKNLEKMYISLSSWIELFISAFNGVKYWKQQPKEGLEIN